MIISVDIDEMAEISNTLQFAKEKIDESANIVSHIVEHNNWNCRERDTINQKIYSIKSQQKNMQEKFEIFAEKIKISATQFSEIDSKTLTAFRNLDALFSQILSIPAVSTSNDTRAVIIGETINNIKNINVNDGFSSYAIGGICDPIRVCKFSSILFAKK